MALPAFLPPLALRAIRRTLPYCQPRRSLTHQSPTMQNADIKRIGPMPGKPIHQVVVHNRLAYITGTVDKTSDGTPYAETAGILRNLDARLALAGTDKSRLLSATVWMADLSGIAEMNRAWVDWLPADAAPARATVQAALGKGFSIEVAATAALPAQRRTIATSDAAAAVGPYNQAVVVEGGTVYVSGCIGLLPGDGGMVDGGVEAQARQTLANVGAILKAAGCGPGDVVKTTVLLANIADFAAVNAIYQAFFEGSPVPARSCFAAKELPKGALVEIDVIAVQS